MTVTRRRADRRYRRTGHVRLRRSGVDSQDLPGPLRGAHRTGTPKLVRSPYRSPRRSTRTSFIADLSERISGAPDCAALVFFLLRDALSLPTVLCTLERLPVSGPSDRSAARALRQEIRLLNLRLTHGSRPPARGTTRRSLATSADSSTTAGQRSMRTWRFSTIGSAVRRRPSRK